MIRIDRGRINLLFSTAAFTISSAGSVLLHIVLAVAIVFSGVAYLLSQKIAKAGLDLEAQGGAR